MNTIYLTEAEQKVFDALPDALKKGFKVEAETLKFDDTEEKRATRLRNFKPESPALKKLQSEAQNVVSAEAFTKAASAADLSSLSENDTTELYFLMGPNGVSVMLGYILQNIKSADDMQSFVSLAFVRHGLLLSQSSVSHS